MLDLMALAQDPESLCLVPVEERPFSFRAALRPVEERPFSFRAALRPVEERPFRAALRR